MPEDDEIKNDSTEQETSETQLPAREGHAQSMSKKSRRARTMDEETASEGPDLQSPVPVVAAATERREEKASSSTAHPLRFDLKPRKRRR
jgi:hypothetical protein